MHAKRIEVYAPKPKPVSVGKKSETKPGMVDAITSPITNSIVNAITN